MKAIKDTEHMLKVAIAIEKEILDLFIRQGSTISDCSEDTNLLLLAIKHTAASLGALQTISDKLIEDGKGKPAQPVIDIGLTARCCE